MRKNKCLFSGCKNKPTYECRNCYQPYCEECAEELGLECEECMEPPEIVKMREGGAK